MLRDDVTLRMMDRMEAVADAAPPERRLKSALYESGVESIINRMNGMF
ncbi:hypothetical protein ACFW1P_07665 [Paenibacillus sp. NPDC058910]